MFPNQTANAMFPGSHFENAGEFEKAKQALKIANDNGVPYSWACHAMQEYDMALCTANQAGWGIVHLWRSSQ